MLDVSIDQRDGCIIAGDLCAHSQETKDRQQPKSGRRQVTACHQTQ